MTLIGIADIHSRIARRQRALWLVAIPLTGFAVFLGIISPEAPHTGGPADLAFVGQMIATFSGIAYAAAFSDFFTDPARLGIHELEAASPVRGVILRAGRVLGTFSVVVAPSFLALLILGVVQAITGDPWSIPAAFAVVATIVGPAALIALLISGVAGTLLPRAFGRIVAVLIWFWLAFSTPLLPIPTVNGTIFGVIGDTIGAGYFGAPTFYPPAGPLAAEPTPLTATVSLLWQLVLITILLVAGSRLGERSRNR